MVEVGWRTCIVGAGGLAYLAGTAQTAAVAAAAAPYLPAVAASCVVYVVGTEAVRLLTSPKPLPIGSETIRCHCGKGETVKKRVVDPKVMVVYFAECGHVLTQS
jgi:hypothetical protein